MKTLSFITLLFLATTQITSQLSAQLLSTASFKDRAKSLGVSGTIGQNFGTRSFSTIPTQNNGFLSTLGLTLSRGQGRGDSAFNYWGQNKGTFHALLTANSNAIFKRFGEPYNFTHLDFSGRKLSGYGNSGGFGSSSSNFQSWSVTKFSDSHRWRSSGNRVEIKAPLSGSLPNPGSDFGQLAGRSVVPEPSTYGMLGACLLSLLVYRRRFLRRKR